MARTETLTRQAESAATLEPDRDELLRVLTQMVCRLAVQATRSPHPATFRQIAVQELRIASHAEVDLIEKFLSG